MQIHDSVWRSKKGKKNTDHAAKDEVGPEHVKRSDGPLNIVNLSNRLAVLQMVQAHVNADFCVCVALLVHLRPWI